MKRVTVVVAVLPLLLSTLHAACSVAGESVAFGNDRIVLAEPNWPGDCGDGARYRWPDERHVAAGRPFRDGVLVAALPASLSHNECNTDVCLAHVCEVLVEGTVGYFVDKIETERDFEALLFRLYNVRREDWLTPDELRAVFTKVEAAPDELRLGVWNKEFEPELLRQGVVHRDGVWLVNFVAQSGASLVDFKFAIDGRNRVGYRRRTLVRGPGPLYSGPGAYNDERAQGEARAFASAFPFLRSAIVAAKKSLPGTTRLGTVSGDPAHATLQNTLLHVGDPKKPGEPNGGRWVYVGGVAVRIDDKLLLGNGPNSIDNECRVLTEVFEQIQQSIYEGESQALGGVCQALDGECRRLEQYVSPPHGTRKKVVDGIFGTPVFKRGKGPDYYAYSLKGNKDNFLEVRYNGNEVQYAGPSSKFAIHNAGPSGVPYRFSESDVARCRGRIAELQAIIQANGEKLRNAPWNRR